MRPIITLLYTLVSVTADGEINNTPYEVNCVKTVGFSRNFARGKLSFCMSYSRYSRIYILFFVFDVWVMKIPY